MYTSYAQNLEDVMLQRVFSNLPNGFYIDIGAWHPDKDSVTKLFYDRGWRGINVEPTEYYFKLLTKSRPRDICLNVAVSGEAGEQDFYAILGSGLSSLDRESVQRANLHGFSVRKIPAKTVPLQWIVNAHCLNQEIAFLKIDVEGHEAIVLKSVDWSSFRPVVVLIESVHPDTGSPAWGAWEGFLLAQGYLFVWFDGLNRFYLRNESSELKEFFNCQPNVFDEFRLNANHALVTSNSKKSLRVVKSMIPVSFLPFFRSLYRRWLG
jgi:FkbM family methyltransferase